MSAKPRRYLLDTSALIAMIEAEEGGKRVRDLMANQTILITFMSLLELRYITLRELGQTEADQRYGLLRRFRAQLMLTCITRDC